MSSLVPLPCLAFNRGKYSDEPILFSISEKKATPCDMDELTGKTTWATPHGWFLVRHPAAAAAPPATFLWNPGNGDKIHLPPLREDLSSECTCLLSDKPDLSGDGKFVVLLLEKYGPVLWYCHAGADGGDNGGWARHEYDIGTQVLYPDETLHEKLVITPVAACRGRFYFSTGFEELGVIEFRPATAFSSIAMREVVAGGYGVADNALVFMVESEGQVHMVNLLFEGSLSSVVYEVSVYRMDFSGRQWRRVRDLGGRAFLLSSLSFGAARSADKCGLEQDCVYMSYPWDKSLMIYNVKDGTMKMESLDGAPESMRALWMLPTD
ncbi:hypothetical protein ACP70R_010669 [Stipagrostis hirtigluma subsp. patula]